ncbi:MAG: glycosyltransferase family 2 protein [Candidatus Hermodarchaeota archaeon]
MSENVSYNNHNLTHFNEPYLSIILPVYNEEKSIKNVIYRIPEALNYEVIIVDDGSTDNTVQYVKEIKNPNIKILKYVENQGYGAALLIGLKHARGDIIITLDSDGQHDPQEIPNLIKPILNNEADIAIGSSYKGNNNYNYPLYRKIGEFIIRVIIWIFYYQEIDNNQSGFRALKKTIKHIFYDIKHKGMGFTTEFLFRACSHKLKIKEVPISVNARAHGSTKAKISQIVRGVCGSIIRFFRKKF